MNLAAFSPLCWKIARRKHVFESQRLFSVEIHCTRSPMQCGGAPRERSGSLSTHVPRYARTVAARGRPLDSNAPVSTQIFK